MAGPDEKKGESFASLFEQSAGARARQRRFRPGERVEVTIVAVGRDAVFADLGAKQEGYFDSVELCDAHGKLTVGVGAKIAAVVAESDDASGQIRLSPVFVRQTSAEAPVTGGEGDELRVSLPVTRSSPLLIEGARVKGQVTGVERYGVFVQIAGTSGRGGRGLVPASETGTSRGADLKKHFAAGQEVEAKILTIAEDGKIRLSISALKADEERGEYERHAEEARTRGGGEAPTGFGTLGDMLKKRKR